jgi:ubiquinone/menaquinone biosynthesis C-methylase UbiE
LAAREREGGCSVNRAALDAYRCPYSGDELSLEGADEAGGEIVRASLVSAGGLDYAVLDGVPHLIHSDRESYSPEEARENEFYEATARRYDAAVDWLFQAFFEDEAEVRGRMVDLLELAPGDRVLETGAGTCRDTVTIAGRLGPDGELFVQDLSPNMLSIGRARMLDAGLLDRSHGRTEFFVGNAAHLPFPDRFFDAAYHFGGFNVFTDRRKALAEMARVVRVGGKVVVGDEGLAPWHRGTEYGAMLTTSHPPYVNAAPLDLLPECASDAGVRWVMGNAFYVVDFRVGDGPPIVALDLPIPGTRGGTFRTRYHGALEGVTVEARELAERGAAASGLSLHEWLDRAVRAAAAQEPDDRT